MKKSIVNYIWQKLMDEQYKSIANLVRKAASGGKLMDFGCGDGTFTLRLLRQLGGIEAYGVEIDNESIELAERNGLKIEKCDLNDALPFEEDGYDVVTAIQIIEHLTNTDIFIKEIFRVLKPGGYAVISTPNLAALHNIAFLLLGWQPPTCQVSDRQYFGNPMNYKRNRELHDSKGHLRIFTRKALKEILVYYGFEVEQVFCTGYMPLFLNRILSHLIPDYGVHLIAKARKPENDS